jgi:hypothetical protein
MRPMLALGLALVLAGPAHADSVTDQLDQAKLYYGQGDIAGAIGELEFAMQELRGRLGAAYLATFPQPPAGWTLVPAEPEATSGAMPFLGGGNMLRREYRNTAGDASIDAQLMTGGSFLQGLASMFMSPQVLAAQPGAKRVRIGRENAVATYDPAERTGQLMLDVGGKVSIMLDGKGLSGTEPLVDLASHWDIQKVKQLAGL